MSFSRDVVQTKTTAAGERCATHAPTRTDVTHHELHARSLCSPCALSEIAGQTNESEFIGRHRPRRRDGSRMDGHLPATVSAPSLSTPEDFSLPTLSRQSRTAAARGRHHTSQRRVFRRRLELELGVLGTFGRVRADAVRRVRRRRTQVEAGVHDAAVGCPRRRIGPPILCKRTSRITKGRSETFERS